MENNNIRVFHYMKTDHMEGFEFETSRSLHLEHEGLDVDYFRLELHETGEKFVMVASPEEFFVHEDVTPLFDLSMIEQECRKQLNTEEVHDSSLDFINFLRSVKEEEYSFS